MRARGLRNRNSGPLSGVVEDMRLLALTLLLAGCPHAEVETPAPVSPPPVQLDPKDLLEARRADVIAAYGAFDTLPPGAKRMAMPYTLRGRLPVYGLSVEHQAFIDAYDFVPDPEPAVTLEVLQVLFRHRQFEEARMRALLFLQMESQTPEAAEVAALLLDSFMQHGDAAWSMATLEFMRELWAKRLDQLDRAQSGMERLAWVHCQHLREEDLLEEAGNSWLDFAVVYESSDKAPDAWLAAADMYQKVELPEDAAEALDEFVKRYPADARAAEAAATRDRLRKP